MKYEGTAYRPRDRYGYTQTLVQVDLVDGPYDPRLGDHIGAISYFFHEDVYAALGADAAMAVLDHDEPTKVQVEISDDRTRA